MSEVVLGYTVCFDCMSTAVSCQGSRNDQTVLFRVLQYVTVCSKTPRWGLVERVGKRKGKEGKGKGMERKGEGRGKDRGKGIP